MTEEPRTTIDIQKLITQHPAEVAEVISQLPDEEAVDLLHRLFQRRKAASTLGEMEPEEAARLFISLSRNEKVQIIERMYPDDAVDLLEELPDEMVEELLARLDRQESEELSQLLNYPQDTAGGLMSPDIVTIPVDGNSQETIDRLRSIADAETVYYLYVVDHDRKLVGVLTLKDLVFAPPDRPIADIVYRDVVKLPVDMDAEEVANIFDKYNYLALPVVDGENRLLGIVTVDDVMDQMREETTEDFLRMAGIPAGEEHPLEEVPSSVKKRLPWMMANIFFNLVAVIGVAVFEESIAQVAFLAVLMPIVSDMGGNVAMQAMSVVIRGIAVGQVAWSQVMLVLRKELMVGFINGAVLGLQLSIITYVWRGNIYLGLVAAMALWLNTVLATMIGAFFPFIMKKLGFDPAMMSGAIITTITDLCGFFMFLGLATMFLHHIV